MAQIDMSSGSASAYGAGELQLQGKVQMTATLTPVTDNLNVASPLLLSTSLVQTTSTLKITTSDVAYIDAEDNSGNNRFTVSRAVASQLVTVDFASVPTALTTPVGAIRTATDGVNLANVATFLENGKIGLGTDTPATKLEVNDSNGVVGTFKSSSYFGSIDLENTGGTVPAKWNVQSVSGAQVGGTAGDAFGIYSYAASAYRMFINSSGNVGIGTSTPTAKLDVTTTGTASYSASALPTATITTPTTGTINAAYTSIHIGARGQFGQGQAVAITNVPTADGDSAMAFTTQNSYAYSEKMRITSAGNVGIGTTSPAVPLDVIGNIRSSTGILFGTDTAAANALDDYEEGTWTMGISFGGNAVGVTYSANTGTYTKIGRQVTLNGILSLSSKGSSTGTSRITGLPFVIGSTSGNYSAPALRFNAVTFINQFQGYGAIGDVVIIMEQITNLGATTTLTDTNFANNSDIIISMTYFV